MWMLVKENLLKEIYFLSKKLIHKIKMVLHYEFFEFFEVFEFSLQKVWFGSSARQGKVYKDENSLQA